MPEPTTLSYVLNRMYSQKPLALKSLNLMLSPLK